jgi:hypothetical protein
MVEAVIEGSKSVPFYRRRWFIILLLITISPIAWIPLFSGKIYRKSGDLGLWIPVKRTNKAIYILLSFWLTAVIIYHYAPEEQNNPNSTSESNSTNPPSTATTTVTASNAPAMCNDSDTVNAVKGAIEESPASKLISIKVEDIGNEHELYFDEKKNVRFCQADVLLNSGETKLSYRVFFGPSGDQAVEEQIGEDAYNTVQMKKSDVVLTNKTASISTPQSTPVPRSNDSEIGPKPGTAHAQASQTDQPSCKELGIRQRMKYSIARQIVIASGFRPAAPPSSDGSYCSIGDNADSCKSYPEIEDCSSDGYCKMDFANTDKHTLSITIFGDGPADSNASVTGFTAVCN